MFISTIVALLSAVVAYASPIQFEERAGVVPPQGFNMYVTGPDKNTLLLTFLYSTSMFVLYSAFLAWSS
jgi:hypothetical protein